MADLRIVDAPEIPTENITGEEKLPTGGSGNYSITLDSIADYTKTKKDLVDTATVDGQLTLKANKVDVYTKSETYTKQESSDLVNNSISTALTPLNTSLDLVKRGIANRYDSSLNYNSGELVVLVNGDIVKSTIDGNVNDPNVDMYGWFLIGSDSITTSESISDLDSIATWNGRCVFVDNVGTYKYVDSVWEFQENALTIFDTSIDLAQQITDALNNSYGTNTIIIKSGSYFVNSSQPQTRLNQFTSVIFCGGVSVDVRAPSPLINIHINRNYFQFVGNGVAVDTSWTENENSAACLQLEDFSLAKSAEVSGLSLGLNSKSKYQFGIKGVGLNLPIFKDNILNSHMYGFYMTSQDTQNTSSHAMGQQFRDNIVYCPFAYVFENNGVLSCEGWTISGGEVIGDTFLQVINNRGASYSIAGRVADIHTNVYRFCNIEAMNRIFVDNVDIQLKIGVTQKYKGVFEFAGVQGFNIGNYTITKVLNSGAVNSATPPIFAYLSSANNLINAFHIIGEGIVWLTGATSELVYLESDSVLSGTVSLSEFKGDHSGRLITQGFESKLYVSKSMSLNTIRVNYGYAGYGSASFNVSTGVLTLGQKPLFGEIYKITPVIVPDGSVINKIVTNPVMGEVFQIIFDASNITISHNANLLCHRSSSFVISNEALIVKSLNFDQSQILMRGYQTPVTTSTTTSALTSISNNINASQKYLGREVYNTTNGKFMKATGSTAGSKWISTDGSTTITPV